MKKIPEEHKYLIANSETYPKDFHCPNPRGWYHSVGNVVATPEGLVAVYRLSDSHCAVYSHIMVAYSDDGGKSWHGHHSISHRNAWWDHCIWIAPQLSRLRDGRLVVICDLGHRTTHHGWPMLSQWQKRPPRGMANYLFWSEDNGRIWSDPIQCDKVGGEPGYVIELSDGTLVYTRTDSAESDAMEDPPLPWGNIYYRNTAVFSDDGGKTWERTSIITDAPSQGDCEVGLVEMEPGHLMAITRIGFGGGQFGQPSRLVHSFDNGRSWEEPSLTPLYAQRPAVHKLQSGKLMVTYRNRWGTPASYAFVWDPNETLKYEPTSFIWDEDRCRIEGEEMVLQTDEGEENQVMFSLYPAIDRRSRVEVEAEVRLDAGETAGCVLYTGCFIRLTSEGILLPDNSGEDNEVDATGKALKGGMERVNQECIPVDTTEWHRYQFVREGGKLSCFVDGELALKRSIKGLESRLVRFGSESRGVSRWKSVKAMIENPDDYSIHWDWKTSMGYPDQFRRDRMVVLDYTGDSGYSNWDQAEDGTIVIVDYTNDDFRNAGWEKGVQPVLKAYLAKEEDLS